MPRGDPTKTVGVRLTESTYANLTELAKKKRMSVSQYMRYLIEHAENLDSDSTNEGKLSIRFCPNCGHKLF